MTKPRDYESIPGTYVYDSVRGRIGYALNMFCMSLNKAENRQRFKENEAAYLDRFALTSEQRRTVLERDWLGMLRVGGNIYYTIKIARGYRLDVWPRGAVGVSEIDTNGRSGLMIRVDSCTCVVTPGLRQ